LSNQLPHHAVAEIVPSGPIDLLSLWAYTDTLYLQDFVFPPYGPTAHMKGLFGRGGVAEYVTPTGALRGPGRYGHLEVPEKHLAGPLVLVFAVALRNRTPVARTPVFLCSRRGIRFPSAVTGYVCRVGL